MAVNTFGSQGLVSRRQLSAFPQSSAFYAFDPQGSVAHRITSGGSISFSDTYDAYGNTLTGNPSSDVWGYKAQWGYHTDHSTGLQLLTFRYYDPQNGRWVTRDPMGFKGGINFYGYFLNNPLSRLDSSGHWSLYRLFYTGDPNASDEVYQSALEGALEGADCYMNCLKAGNTNLWNWGGGIGGSAVIFGGVPRPTAEWIAGRGWGSGTYLKCGIRAIGIRLRNRFLLDAAARFKGAGILGRGGQIVVAGAAIVETSLAIKCAAKCTP